MPFYFGRDSNYECDLKVEQSELLKIEDQVQIVTSQLTDAEHQKSEMRAEITKLNRSIWNERRARLLHND